MCLCVGKHNLCIISGSQCPHSLTVVVPSLIKTCLLSVSPPSALISFFAAVPLFVSL